MNNKSYIYLLAFFTGMSIMAIELSASRVVAPYFGTSTYVWTNVIGIIMVALSIGYFVGGRLADRQPYLRLLLKILLSSSILLFAIPFAAPSLSHVLVSFASKLESSFAYIFFGSLALVTILFSFPIVLLGMTSPFLIRISALNNEIGVSAGRIFGISTFGSIVGTFLPTLIFIPSIGTGKTILFFAMLQLIVSALGFIGKKGAPLLSLMVIPFFFPVPASREIPGQIFSAESEYQRISVADRGVYRYLLYNDGMGFQTVARKDSSITGFYFDYFSLIPTLFNNEAKSVLLLGLGGGIIANQIHAFYPKLDITAVEIDPRVITIAKNYFSLTRSARIYNQDGRVFVGFGKSTYDMIFIDSYTQQLYIPFHMTTVEFFTQVKKRLNQEGIVAMNVAGHGDDSRICKAIINTLHLVFTHVYRLRIPNSYSSLVIAADRDIDYNLLIRSAGTKLQDIGAYALGDILEVPYYTDEIYFTDDRAPTESMIDWELLRKSG